VAVAESVIPAFFAPHSLQNVSTFRPSLCPIKTES
jgi:hypothetical protein